MPARAQSQKNLARLQKVVLKPAQDASEPMDSAPSGAAQHDSFNPASIEARVHATSSTLESIMNRPLPMPRGGINE